MLRQYLRVTLLVVVFITINLSCDKSSPIGTGDDDSQKTVVSENVIVVEQQADIAVSEITDDEIVITFSGQELQIETGDVLVSGNGTGYLRKVNSVTIEGNSATVETEQAALTDIIEEGWIDTIVTLDLGVEQLAKGIGVMKTANGVTTKTGGLDLSGTVLFSGTTENTSANLTITSGTIEFTPTIHLLNEINKSSTKHFQASMTGTLDFDFEIEAMVSGQLAMQDSVTLVDYQHIAVQMVDYVPVVEVYSFEIQAGYYVDADARGEFATGFEHSRKIKVGAEYGNTNWQEIWEITPEQPVFTERTTTFTTKAGITVQVFVKPIISVRHYDVAGPYFDIRPYLQFDGEINGEYVWGYGVKGGLSSNLGFDVSVIGAGIANKNWELLSADKVFASHFEERIPIHEIHGIPFATIPGGTFQMGDFEKSGQIDEKPVHTVTVSTFEMSTCEITNAQYAQYLNEALASDEIEVTSDWVYGKTGSWAERIYLDMVYIYDTSNQCWITYDSGIFSVIAGHENWPVVEVTWYGAKAFTEHYGIDLPREAEWEYASRWGSNQYKYGTDDGTIHSSKANYNNNIGHPVAVGSYPANPLGLHDMCGNVYEWCVDWYGSYTGESQIDPTGAPEHSHHVLRGGSWNYIGDNSRSANRYDKSSVHRDINIGFRVVRRPVQ